MAILSAKNIHKKYGTVEVLRGVDIEVEKGEIVSIVGPSGSGKSTLLHILGTLDKADAGEVFLRDANITFLNGDNVCIPGWLSSRKKSAVQERAQEILVLLGLKDRLENKPNELSGGEQQRVAVARALINNPEVVFADEPSGNLDSANAKELHQLFFDLRQQFKQTFLIVTHNEELAQQSDRMLTMKDGKIISQ